MLELVEVDGFKFVLEDCDDFLLEKPDKLGGNIGDLKRNFTLHVLFLLFAGLGPGLLGLALRRRGSGCNNLGFQFFLKAFQLELEPCLYNVFPRLGLLEVGLGL